MFSGSLAVGALSWMFPHNKAVTLLALQFWHVLLLNDNCLPFRRHVAVDELRHNSVHRVQRHPPRLGRAHIANTILDVG